MQDTKLFEKLAKPDFSKSCGRWEAHRHTKLQANSKPFACNLVLHAQAEAACAKGTLRYSLASAAPLHCAAPEHFKREML